MKQPIKEKMQNLSLKNRLLIASVSMVLIPVLMTFLSFWCVRFVLLKTMGESASSVLALTQQKANSIFFMDMFLAIVIIIFATAIVMTRIIQRWFIRPIADLNEAMNHIAQGDLDFRVDSTYNAEMGEVFANYEDMRLRLKESIEISIENERKNRELISNISHDLKTPITSIQGYVEGIMDGVADTPEKMDKYIRTIHNKSNELNRLLNELTFYSGIDSNRIPYHFRKVSVGAFFQDCVEEIGLDLESKGIELNFDNLVTADTQIIADPEQLSRVVGNIISNSVKYMDRADGRIELRILDELDSIRVEIEDNGKGINARDLGQIFERFYRTDSSRNSSTGGSGIGLSIVKKIVEDHGGYIWATSKEGEGTCMHFVIRKYVESSQ